MSDKPSLRWKICHWLHGGNNGVKKRMHEQGMRELLIEQGFKNDDPNVIATFSDMDLATCQSQHKEGSRHFILAAYEWQRRLIVQQIKATYRAAWIGILGVVIGIVGSIIVAYLT